MVRRHLTFANIASATALAVALAGSGAAVAAGLAPGSVRSVQIANGQVRTPDLANGAVTGAKVKNDSLTGADVRESTLVLPPASRVYSGDTPVSPVVVSAGTPMQVASVDAVAPKAGFVTVTANATTNDGAPGSSVFLDLHDGDRVVATLLWSSGSAGWTAQSSTVAVPATPGAHRYRLTAYVSSGTARVYLPQLTALFVPAGRAGVAPAAD